MASDPPADLALSPIYGQARSVREWLTTFHLLLLVLDPYTNESSWVLPVAQRVVKTLEESDCRVAYLLTASADDCRRFLGPLAEDTLTFADPDRAAVKALGLERLPAVVHLAMDGTVGGAAEGWHPAEWRRVTHSLARTLQWAAPRMPAPKDPGPFTGTPALSA